MNHLMEEIASLRLDKEQLRLDKEKLREEHDQLIQAKDEPLGLCQTELIAGHRALRIHTCACRTRRPNHQWVADVA